MVDFEKIGRRITEQRKMQKISQSQMASELQDYYLSMHQADISNLEKAKKGSGITDLDKLDRIADYLDLPLETLLFGIGGGTMQKYYGSQMTLRASKKKPLKQHLRVLSRLLGCPEDEIQNLVIYECGMYMLYSAFELQMPTMCSLPKIQTGETVVPHPLQTYRTYIFYDQELVSVATTAMTTVDDHFFGPGTEGLEIMYQNDAVDPTDVYRTLNPYWALWKYAASKDEKETNYGLMANREADLCALGSSNLVLYVESVYVREDCRQNGIFRMYIDWLKTLGEEDEIPIIWLNMEPTTGIELEQVNRSLPSYTVSDLGQININAAIAERIGFTIDPVSCYRETVTLNDDGSSSIGRIQVRKYAYLLPKAYRDLLANDGNLVADGRARQHLAEMNAKDQILTDIKHGPIDGYEVVELRNTYIAGPRTGERMIYYAARSMEDESIVRLGVSKRSVVDAGLFHDGQLEMYDNLEDAAKSEYWIKMGFAYQWIIGLPDPEMESVDENDSEEPETGSDVGLAYVRGIGFRDRKGINSMAKGLIELYGKEKALEWFDARSNLEEGSLAFYEFKNQDIHISTLISECYDADALRKICNYLYENREFIKGRVLEVGCESGYITGFLAQYFPDIQITAIDRSAKAVSVAQERMRMWGINNVRFLVADVADIDEQFDTVLTIRTAYENISEDALQTIFDGDELSAQFKEYREIFDIYAASISSRLCESGHLISVERFPVSLLAYGWLSALNKYSCRLNKKTFEYLYCKEMGDLICHTGFVADAGASRNDTAIQKFILRRLVGVNDEHNLSSATMRKGWPAIAYFAINKGVCIKDTFIVDSNGAKVGRFAAYYDKDDQSSIIFLKCVNRAENTELQVGVEMIRDEIIEQIMNAERINEDEGHKCVPYNPDDYMDT